MKLKAQLKAQAIGEAHVDVFVFVCSLIQSQKVSKAAILVIVLAHGRDCTEQGLQARLVVCTGDTHMKSQLI